jgi:hypothetical protein
VILRADPAGVDAAIARLRRARAGWQAPALPEMARAMETAIRAKFDGNPRAKGLLEVLRVEVDGNGLRVSFPTFAERFHAADFARGDFSAYQEGLSTIAARALAAALA